MSARPRAIPRALRIATVLFAIALAIPLAAIAGRGDPDRSFGGDGVAAAGAPTRSCGPPPCSATASWSRSASRAARPGALRLLVVRFNRNGSLDRSFSPGGPGLPLLGGGGGGGIYVGPRGTTARGVAIQRDGKIVVAGARTDNAGTAHAGDARPAAAPERLARPLVSAATGWRRRWLPAAARPTRSTLDGRKIVVAGSATLGRGERRASRASLSPASRPTAPATAASAAGGARVLDFGRLSFANAVEVRGDGRIVIAGSQRDDLQTTNLLVARLTAAGRARSQLQPRRRSSCASTRRAPPTRPPSTSRWRRRGKDRPRRGGDERQRGARRRSRCG